MQSRQTHLDGPARLKTDGGASSYGVKEVIRQETISTREDAQDAFDHPTKSNPPLDRNSSGEFSSDDVTLWLRRADQLLLGFLLIALMILLIAFRWKLSGGFRTEIEIVNQQPREYYYSIDINKASWVEWAQLDGIGEKLARRIVQDRAERGPFQLFHRKCSAERIRRDRLE